MQAMSRLRARLALWRRMRGARRHPDLAAALADCSRYKVLSFDCFDTLVQRQHRDPAAALAYACAVIGDRLHAAGIAHSPDRILAARREAECRARRAAAHGEVTISHIQHETARLLGLDGATWAGPLADWEVSAEIDGLRAAPGAAAALDQARAAGARVVVSSDMYWRTQDFVQLFQRLGLPAPDRFLVSGELGVSKRAGAFFDRLLASEAVGPSELCHIGDDAWSDIIPARQRGIAWRWIGHASRPARRATDEDRLHRIGREILGPLLTAYVAQCAVAAHHASPPDQAPILAFLSRDGWILHRIHGILRERHPRIRALACHASVYCHLSRMSVVPASLHEPLEDLTALASLQGRDASMAALIQAANLPVPPPGASDESLAEAIARWHGDAVWRQSAIAAWAQAREGLAGYLRGLGLIAVGHPLHLVDIGWYGTIPMALHRAMPALPATVYHRLGARHRPWPFARPAVGPVLLPAVAADESCDRASDRALIRFLAILETVCGPDEGSCLGYRRDGGSWLPVLAPATRMDGRRRAAIQHGILSAAEAMAADVAWSADPGAACRAAAGELARFAARPHPLDALALGGLRYDIGWGSGREVNFIDDGLRWWQPWLTPRRFLARLRAVAWVEGSMSASRIPGWHLLHRIWRSLPSRTTRA